MSKVKLPAGRAFGKRFSSRIVLVFRHRRRTRAKNRPQGPRNPGSLPGPPHEGGADDVVPRRPHQGTAEPGDPPPLVSSSQSATPPVCANNDYVISGGERHSMRRATSDMAWPSRLGVSAMLDRLIAALTDPARRERAVVPVLAGYCALWALYGAIAKGSQDIHFDMGEMVAWSRETFVGHAETSAVRRLAGERLVRRLSARRLGLLSVRDGAGDAGAVDRLDGRRPLPRRREAGGGPGAAHPGAVLQFPCAEVQRQHGDDPAVGGDHGAVPALLRDAQSGLGRARRPRGGGRDARQVLVDRPAARPGVWRRSPIRAAPPISARRRRGRRSRPASSGSRPTSPGSTPTISRRSPTRWRRIPARWPRACARASPTWRARPATRRCRWCSPRSPPGRSARRCATRLWPTAPERRLVVLAFALPLALPLLLAVAAREQVVSLWSIGSMTLLPVVLLSSPAVTLPSIAVRRIVGIALAFPLIALAASPLIAYTIHRDGVPNYATHYSGLARAVRTGLGRDDRPAAALPRQLQQPALRRAVLSAAGRSRRSRSSSRA